MKNMSKCLKTSDCAETLEEARGVIDRLENRITWMHLENRRLRFLLAEVVATQSISDAARDDINAALANARGETCGASAPEQKDGA